MNKDPILDNDVVMSDNDFVLSDEVDEDFISSDGDAPKFKTARQRIEDLMDLKRLKELVDSIELDDLLH